MVTGDAELDGSTLAASAPSSEAVGAPLLCVQRNNDIWVASPLQLSVAMSMTYCYLSNESFDFFFKVLINNGG